MVVFLKRPGGQAQFSQNLKLQGGDGRFDKLHGWILENLAADLSLAQLADHANMSRRSFSRRYREATVAHPPARSKKSASRRLDRLGRRHGPHPDRARKRRLGAGTGLLQPRRQAS
ncbi:AraC family transcriptional regulator, partial [Mesorhizobium sp. M8A.F.Ca.ET.207.01.1.1]